MTRQSLTLCVATVIYVIRAIDLIPHLLKSEFSIGRLVTRIVGYHVMYELLMSKASPLRLPEHLHDNVKETLQWPDRKATKLMRRIEIKLTTGGANR